MRLGSAKIDGCWLVELGHLQVMHKGVNVKEVQDKPLCLDPEIFQLAYHLNSLEDFSLQAWGEWGDHLTKFLCEVAEVHLVTPLQPPAGFSGQSCGSPVGRAQSTIPP